MKKNTLCYPHKPVYGGPGNFQIRLSNYLISKGWKIFSSEDKVKSDIILVVGITRKMIWLIKNKFKKTPIILRLDGINWFHKAIKKPFIYNIKSELMNYLSNFIRLFLADHIIYQSNYVKDSWQNKFGIANCPDSVIYNGVEINNNSNIYNKAGKKPKLLFVEGEIQHSPVYIEPIRLLYESFYLKGRVSDVVVIGKIDPKDENYLNINCPNALILDELPHDEVLNFFPNSVYISLEINPPCPNSVIEALSFGCPVVGFDTGSLSELVDKKSGMLISYNSNPDELELPSFKELPSAVDKIINDYATFSNNALQRAVNNFDIEFASKKYMEVFQKYLG